MSCAKMAEPIEMLFGMWTLVGPGNHVLDGCPDRPMTMGNVRGKNLHAVHLLVCLCFRHCVQRKSCVVS